MPRVGSSIFPHARQTREVTRSGWSRRASAFIVRGYARPQTLSLDVRVTQAMRTSHRARIPDPAIAVIDAWERPSQSSLLEWRGRSRSSATGRTLRLHLPPVLASRARDARRAGSTSRGRGLSPCRRAGFRSARARRPSARLRCGWPRRPCDRCSSGGTSPSAPPPRAPCRSRCSRARARAR